MYSRFQTWQQAPKITLEAEVTDVNEFRVNDASVDIRFGLKGYGFKRAGEKNRVIYHFGSYRCFFRRVGDADFTPFANVLTERADSEDDDVYRDIGVTTGLIPSGQYDIRIEATRLLELEAWSAGIVEGISSGGKFHFDIEARQSRVIKTRPIETVSVQESINLGFDPIDLDVIEEIQTATIPFVENIVEVEDVSDTLTVIESVTIGPPV